MCHKDADGMANSVDPDQTAPVCKELSVRKLGVITVHDLIILRFEQCDFVPQ